VRPLFITATGTGVGKTHAARMLIRIFGRKGIRVGACKPVETGVSDVPADAALLLDACQSVNPAFDTLEPEDLCAYTFPLPAAPFCADKKGRLSLDGIFEKIRQLQRHCDLLIIEGAGGLMVPLTQRYFMIDLAEEVGAHTLLVTSSRLGCINETLLSLEALGRRRLSHDWCVNIHEDAGGFPEVTRPYYDAAFPGWWSLREGMEDFADRYAEEHGRRRRH